MTSEKQQVYVLDEKAMPIFDALLKRHALLQAQRAELARQLRRLDADLGQVELAAQEAGQMYLETRKLPAQPGGQLTFDQMEDGTIRLTIAPAAQGSS